AVAEVHHALQCIAALTAEQDGRVWFLLGLGPRPDRIEGDELAVELGDVLRPDLLHRAHLLLEPLEARLELRAVVLHLLGVPAAAQPELEAPVREQVEARDRLGRRDRVALDDQADAGAHPELLRRGRRGGQRDERVQGVLVLLRQLLTAGERAAPAGGNVRVLGHPQRLEVARLGLARQLVDADRVLGGEDAESDLHCRSSWIPRVVVAPGAGAKPTGLGTRPTGLGTSEKCVWVASQRPWRRSKASVQRPGRGKVPPPGRVPSESQVAAIQPRSPATAPRARSTSR